MTDNQQPVEEVHARWVAVRFRWIRAIPFVTLLVVPLAGRFIGWWSLTVAALFVVSGLCRVEIYVSETEVATRTTPASWQVHEVDDLAGYCLAETGGFTADLLQLHLLSRDRQTVVRLDLPASVRRRAKVLASLERAFADSELPKAG